MCMAKYKPNLPARLTNHSMGLINMFLVLCTHYVTKYLEEKNPYWIMGKNSHRSQGCWWDWDRSKSLCRVVSPCNGMLVIPWHCHSPVQETDCWVQYPSNPKPTRRICLFLSVIVSFIQFNSSTSSPPGQVTHRYWTVIFALGIFEPCLGWDGES